MRTAATLSTRAGTYSYHISGDGDYGDDYYNILKIFNVTDEDIAAGTMTVEVTGGKLGINEDAFGDGYQPTVKPSHAPETYVMDARDNMLCIWPDEILDQRSPLSVPLMKRTATPPPPSTAPTPPMSLPLRTRW